MERPVIQTPGSLSGVHPLANRADAKDLWLYDMQLHAKERNIPRRTLGVWSAAHYIYEWTPLLVGITKLKLSCVKGSGERNADNTIYPLTIMSSYWLVELWNLPVENYPAECISESVLEEAYCRHLSFSTLERVEAGNSHNTICNLIDLLDWNGLDVFHVTLWNW